MRVSVKAAAIVAATILMTQSAAVAVPVPAFPPDAAAGTGLVQEASLAQKKAATKAWFKRKGNQTANWFNRQKNKVERKLAD